MPLTKPAGYCSVQRLLLLVMPLIASFACRGPSIGMQASDPMRDLKATSRLHTWPADHLEETKKRIAAGSMEYQAALKQLIVDADEALMLKPASVMDKVLTGKSGDKHDYFSMGPYWWPDPTKPDGLPYVQQDGRTNPESVKGTDSKAFNRTCRALATLGLAYHLTGHVSYAEQGARLARVWFLNPATRMNPHLEYGQAIPGRYAGRPTGIIDTAILIEATEGMSLLAGSVAWSGADQSAFRAWINAYLDWLLTSSHGKIEAVQKNNHGTWYDAQLVQFALLAGRKDLAREILLQARDLRLGEIAHDGSQPHEMTRKASLPYSAFNLRGLIFLSQQARQLGMAEWGPSSEAGQRLLKAIEYLESYADPSNPWTKGTSNMWGDRRELRECLVLAYDLLGESQREVLRALMERPLFNKERALLFMPSVESR